MSRDHNGAVISHSLDSPATAGPWLLSLKHGSQVAAEESLEIPFKSRSRFRARSPLTSSASNAAER